MLGIYARNSKKRGMRSNKYREQCVPIRELGEDIEGEVPFLEDMPLQERLRQDSAYYKCKRMKKNPPGL